MAEMAKVLKVNINVNNVTGGVGGSVGLFAGYSKPADGYTLVACPNRASLPVSRVDSTMAWTCGTSSSSVERPT
jgi:hypothetical protein